MTDANALKIARMLNDILVLQRSRKHHMDNGDFDSAELCQLAIDDTRDQVTALYNVKA